MSSLKTYSAIDMREKLTAYYGPRYRWAFRLIANPQTLKTRVLCTPKLFDIEMELTAQDRQENKTYFPSFRGWVNRRSFTFRFMALSVDGLWDKMMSPDQLDALADKQQFTCAVKWLTRFKPENMSVRDWLSRPDSDIDSWEIGQQVRTYVNELDEEKRESFLDDVSARIACEEAKSDPGEEVDNPQDAMDTQLVTDKLTGTVRSSPRKRLRVEM